MDVGNLEKVLPGDATFFYPRLGICLKRGYRYTLRPSRVRSQRFSRWPPGEQKTVKKWPFSAIFVCPESDLINGSWDHSETLGSLQPSSGTGARLFGMTKIFKMADWRPF